MSLFNLLKSKHSNFRFKDDNSSLKKEEFETDVLSFYESCSSHIEIIVPNNKLADPSIHDPFLNFQINNSYQVGEENQAVAMKKYLTIPPRFLSITQKQKTDFWTALKSDDPKVFWKLLQKYAIEINKELSIMEKVQNSKFTLPDWVKRANWFEMILALLLCIINVIIFFGYKVNGANESIELLIFNSKVATYVIMYGIGSLICSGYFYIIVIRLIIIFRINWGEFKVSYNKKKKAYKAIPKYAWNRLVNLHKWTLLIIQSQDLWCLIPLDWNRDMGIHRLPLVPLRSKLPFSCRFICFSCNFIVFSCKFKRFSQNQKGNRSKYFAKLSCDFGVKLLDLLRNVENFIWNILVMDWWVYIGLV